MVLGPLQVTDGERAVSLGGTKQRALLAILLLHTNETVSVDRLVDGLWGESVPPTAAKMVQLYVSRLRKELGHERIQTTAPGYVLAIEGDDVDLVRFQALVDAARGTAPDEPAISAAQLREALALWRGEPLAGLEFEPFAQLALPALAELRERVREECVELELALGRHADLVPELEAAVATYPLRERLRGQLMLALYRTGRQADALETYRSGREALVETLGIEPGPDLQRLHAAMLNQDPSLELAAASAAAESVTLAYPRRWPRRLAAIAAVVVLGAAALAAFLLLRPGHRVVTIEPDSVAVLDAASGDVLDDVPVGDGPGPIAAGATGTWVGNREARTIVRIDPRSHEIVQTYGLPSTPERLAVGGTTVWVGNDYSGTISRIVTRFSFLSEPIRLRRGVRGLVAMAATPTELWLGFQDGSVGVFDPTTLRMRETLRGLGSPSEIALGAGSAWVAQTVSGEITRITRRTAKVESTFAIRNGAPEIAFGVGALWAASGGQLYRLDPETNTIASSVPVGAPASAIAVGADTVWVATRDGLLAQVDPQTTTLVRTVRLGHSVAGLAIEHGRLWVTVGA